jgi:colicin import membrane protein
MKTPWQKPPARNLSSEVDLARILLAKAESQLVSAKEQARLARRRRKEAKQAARRAKKQARQAKKQAAEAKLALAEAEEKLAKTNQRRVKTKTQKKPARKTFAARRHKQPGKPATICTSLAVKKKKPASRPATSKPKAGPGRQISKKPVTAPRALKAPGAAGDATSAKATKEIVKGVEEIFGETTREETRVEPVVAENLTPPGIDSSTPDPIATE